MRAFSLFILSALFGIACFGQKPLTNSRRSSFYIYIYAISNADIKTLYAKPDVDITDNMLHHPVDSFKAGTTWQNILPPGNYVKVYAEENKLKYTLLENHSAFLKVLDDHQDLRFVLLDKLGNTVRATRVQVNGHSVNYDAKSGVYYTNYPGKNAWLQASYAGIENYCKIDNNNGNNKSGFFEHLWLWVKQQFYKQNHYHTYQAPKDDYSGFMILNKPLYRPGDSVKFKAFVLHNKSKKPIANRQLLIRLKEQYGNESRIIGRVNSYREGGFEGGFKLADSLKLLLDQNYILRLEEVSGNNLKESEKKTRTVFCSANFNYEEYELKSTQFNMRTDKDEHSPGNLLAVYLKATDENNLPVPDGRVILTLKTSSINHFKSSKIFVPDTLWRHTVTLDPLGETKVLIPDSIFPKADVNYNISAQFLNSSNESRSAQTQVNYYYKRYNIKTTIEQDTLTATAYEWGKPIHLPAKISGFTKDDDTLLKAKVILPAKLKINPVVNYYAVDADSTSEEQYLKDLPSNLSASGYRTADSLFVQVTNPRKILFWYTIYAGKQVIDAGYADHLSYARRYPGSTQPVTIVLNYIWGGESKAITSAISYLDKLLTIHVNQPLSVYPGQQVKTEVEVKDATGRPVADADITAWAITRKFTNYNAPYIPYLGKQRQGMQAKPKLESGAAENGWIRLNWRRWSHEMGLDSIVYYRFTHPKSVFSIEEPAPDTLTQIAPFVVNKGKIIPVHILYIDERPVYFSQAQQLQRYSFQVTPGRHSLRFRTLNQNIRLDSVQVEKGRKLILSLNTDAAINPAIQATKMPDTLTAYEAGLLDKYMIKVTDNFNWRMAYLQQSDKVLLLNPYPQNSRYSRNDILAGPLSANVTELHVYGDKSLLFNAEPNYTYLFAPGLLKQTSIRSKYPFDTHLANNHNSLPDYGQYALTVKETDGLWHNYLDERSRTQDLFTNSFSLKRPTGRLKIEVTDSLKTPFIKNILFYKPADPDFIRVFSGQSSDIGGLDAGIYKVFFLLKNDRYMVVDNIVVKPNGLNYYAFKLAPHVKDSVSIKINKVISSRANIYIDTDTEINNDALKLKEAFSEKYLDPGVFNSVVRGQVIDAETKETLLGVSIKVKGTNYAVVTDINGHFSIKVPASGKLIVSYIGYQATEVDIVPGANGIVSLNQASKSLQEVVVVGYGTVKKSSLTGAISSVLEGRVAGVEVLRTTAIRLRGSSTVINGAEPLYIVDGVPVTSVAGIDPDMINEFSVLQSAAATALYGARAVNGAIVITTKKIKGTADGGQPGSAQTFRHNFSDYAYWQPRLTTDAQGKASFITTFPDDITNWRTFVIGINGQQQTGFAESQIKAFKPLSASFISPQFAVNGDELSAIGKVINYNTDPVSLTRSFSYNGRPVKQDVIQLKTSKIDTLNVIAEGTDSITFEYSIKRDNGYFDGELRKIPLIEQGVIETKGSFAALNKDTTVSFKFDAAFGPVTFRAEASLLPVLTEETERLRQYQYLCNEQLALKLKGLLAQKRIKYYLNEPFRWDKSVKDLIKKLSESSRTSGLWGWWKDTDEELWISLHVIEALLEAQSLGYNVYLNKQQLTDYLVYQLERYRGADKIEALQILKKLDAKVDYTRYINTLTQEQKNKQTLNRYDFYRLLLLQQQAGMEVNLGTLLSSSRSTMFGNQYWGEDNYRFFDNSVQVSLLAYQLFKAEGKHPDVLTKIRGYLLEQRHDNQWRNTYESALILETLLPDLLSGGKQIEPAAITLTGGASQTVTRFPYSTTIKGTGLSINKTGSLPVYVTAYQQYRNRTPEKVSKDFTVNTWFNSKGQKLDHLKGGQPVQYQVEVTARADADFVMIEVPIPAGCSYESKEQDWRSNEVHREYFKEKVTIFCRTLKPGKYTYTINLMPRYSGKYTINPAKAEMMYFPVFYGREGLKKVMIN